ncbi:MAG TPA: phenylalanine--tRNA ligase subunit alpha, partial [bacterium]|nr:phenylalanine--tRNA ligase subunit alpha [bacterium]
MEDRLEPLLREAVEAENLISLVPDLLQLENMRVKFLGKSSLIIEHSKGLAQLPNDQRPLVGKKINEIKSRYNRLLDLKKEELENKSALSVPPDWDPTLPGRQMPLGKMHPLTL